MNNANTEITHHKIIVIEWLDDKDDHTGKKLYDDVIRYKTSSDISILHEHHSVKNTEEFISTLRKIANQHQDGQIITLDIETHGSDLGIGIDSDNGMSWSELFNLTRPVNECCGGLLVITLSCCFGLSHLVAFEPKGRAPFLAIVSSNREMYPDELYEGFSKFFSHYDSPLKINDAMTALSESFNQEGKECPFVMTTSLQWFDEFFREERILPVAAQKAALLAKLEGIDEECAKYQILDDMADMYNNNRAYYNFF